MGYFDVFASGFHGMEGPLEADERLSGLGRA